MVYSSTQLSTDEIAAEASGEHLILAHNVIRDASMREWHAVDLTLGVPLDVTDAAYPQRHTYDGKRSTISRPTDETTSVYWLYYQWTAGVTIDTIYISLGGCAASLSVVVEIADDFNPSTNRIAIYSQSTALSGATILALDLDNDAGGPSSLHQRFSNVQALRITLTNTDGSNTIPQVRQVFAGRRRQLNGRASMPWDEKPFRSHVAETAGSGRQLGSWIEQTGLRVFDGSYLAVTGSTRYQTLDDAVTIRAIASDSKLGTRAVVFVENPATARNAGSHVAYLGFFDAGLAAPTHGPFTRRVSLDFIEQPPGLEQDPPTGIVGDTFEFDGFNEYLSVAHVSGQLLSGAFTAAFWTYTTETNANDQFVSKENVSDRGFAIKHAASFWDRLRVHIATSASDQGTYGAWNGILANLVWQHFVVVFDGSLSGNANRLKVFLNGVLLTADAYVGTIPATLYPSVAPIRFGAGAGGIGALDGKLHNAAVFNAALSAAQVAAVYNYRSNDLRDLSFSGSLICYPGLIDPETAFPTITDYAGLSSGIAVDMEAADITEDRP